MFYSSGPFARWKIHLRANNSLVSPDQALQLALNPAETGTGMGIGTRGGKNDPYLAAVSSIPLKSA